MKCELCGCGRRDTIRYGEFLSKNGKGVHTNCLYLSSGLQQNGAEDEGILGFLPNDIAAERKRVSKTQCCYCGQSYANIGCCETRCYRTFHMICGIECGAMNQFLDTFRSFCDRHVRKVSYRPKPDEECCICYEKIFAESRRFSAANMMRAPCCRNGWFHKYCLQKFAKNAGYFFKCPLCNDSQKFKTSMSYWGVFVQDKDAEWELVPNAYAELLERPNVCGAKICKNPEGRGQSSDANPFQYCITCGSVAIHRHCVPHRDNSYECDTCQCVLNSDSGHESLNSQQQYADNDTKRTIPLDEDENSDVDVCEGDSDEEILPPKAKNKNTLRIWTETEDTSDDDESDVIIMHSTRRIAANKRDIVDDSSTEKNITANMKMGCSKDEEFSSSCYVTKCSEYEGLEVACERPEMPHCSRSHEKETTDMKEEQQQILANNLQTKNHQEECAPNTSFIAQRIRRRSLVALPPSIDEQESADSVSSSTSYQSSKPYQVFQYDDDEVESAAQSASEKENSKYISSSYVQSELGVPNESKAYTGQGLLDYFYALLLEVKQGNKKNEKVTVANAEHPCSNRATQEMVKDVATNAFNVSCIANRTRGCSLIKAKNMPSHVTSTAYKESDEEDMDSISTTSSSPKYDFLNVSCIANTWNRLSNIDVNEEDDAEVDNVLDEPMDCAVTKDGNVDNANAEQHSSGSEQRLKLVEEGNHENIKNEATNVFDISCIANRTRRRSSLKLQNLQNRIPTTDYDEIDLNITVSSMSTDSDRSCRLYANKTAPHHRSSIADVTEEESETEEGKFAPFNVCQNFITKNNSASSNPNESASSRNRAIYSTDSFKSSTYFGRSYEHANDDSSSQISAQNRHQANVISTEPTASTSTSQGTVAAIHSMEVAQKRKSHFESPIPPKISALTEDESQPESCTNIFEQSCIANRTRRKSIDVNKFKNPASTEKNKETFTTNSNKQAEESEPESQTNVFEQSCIANRTRRKSNDLNKLKHAASVDGTKRTLSTNSKVQSTSRTTIFSSELWQESKSNDTDAIKKSSTQIPSTYTLSPSDLRRCQRKRGRPPRFSDDQHDSVKPQTSIIHSPVPNRISWSDLREQNDAYIMRRYTRVNGILKRETVDAQKHFSRSYNLLLQATNDNHRRTSSSRT